MTAPTRASLLTRALAEGRDAPLLKPLDGGKKEHQLFSLPTPQPGVREPREGSPSLRWLLLSGPAVAKPESAPQDHAGGSGASGLWNLRGGEGGG